MVLRHGLRCHVWLPRGVEAGEVVDPEALLPLLELDARATFEHGRVLLDTRTRSVHAVSPEVLGLPAALREGSQPVAGAERRQTGVVVKIDDYRGALTTRLPLRKPRVVREMLNLADLHRLGVPATVPVACGWAREGLRYGTTFLITREVLDSMALKSWVDPRAGTGRPLQPPADGPTAPAPAVEPGGLAASPLTRTELLGLLERLLEQLARLHREGWWIRTCYAKNVLVRRDAEGRPAFALCDVPRLSRHRSGRLYPRGAVRDLGFLDKWGRKALRRGERLRLLRHYLQALGTGSEEGWWIASIDQLMDRKQHRTWRGRASRNLHEFMRRWRRRRSRATRAASTEP